MIQIENKIYKIGLVMKSLQADFFQEMKRGAEAFAVSHPEIELISAGTASQTEIEAQIELVKNFIHERVDALVVVPIDSKALVAPVVKAIKAGIKVVNIDIRLDEDMLHEEGVELTYVGPDNETASRLVGDVLADTLQKGDKVVLIEGLQVAENAQQRRKGFMQSIENHELNLVASGSADWETEKAAEVFAALLAQHSDIKGVFCCNDAMALGVIGVLKASEKAGQVKVVGFDNDTSIKPLLADGSLLATVDAHASQMAVQGIEYAMRLLGGVKGGGVYATKFDLIK